MSKKAIAILIIIVVLILGIVVVYLIDMDRIKNNKPVLFSTWGYDYVPPVNNKILSLEIIKNMVTEKREQLTWNDFEQYKSKEIGSGLYILLYDVDDKYDLMIGGVPNEKPMYLRLVEKQDREQYVDIRYDNIEEFLNKAK